MYKKKLNRGLIVDYFCGGGGGSQGVYDAVGLTGAYVDVAVNHDDAAISLHQANHPKTQHYLQSVFDIEPRKLVDGHLGSDYIDLFIASPDCTHFSRARGSRTKVSHFVRGLAWSIVKVAALPKHQRPRVILVENVEEFITWGPLDENGIPIKERKGENFQSFIKSLQALSYVVEWKTLKAHDYGAATHRERFFLIARCDGNDIVWPKPTHAHRASVEVINGQLKPFQSAGSIVDWSLPLKPVFDREKPLAENTINRIVNGIRKFVVNDEIYFVPGSKGLKAAYIATYYTEQKFGDSRGQILHRPLATITSGGNRFSLVQVDLIPTTITEVQENMPLIHEGSFGLKLIDGIVYSIENPHLRMFQPHELFLAQGFPKDYIISGRITLQEVASRGISEKVWIKNRVEKIRKRRLTRGIDSTKEEIMQLDLFSFAGDLFDTEIVKPLAKSTYSYSKKEMIARVGNSLAPPLMRELVLSNVSHLCEGTQQDLLNNAI